MELSGKITHVLEQRGGVSQRTGNEWKVATYVIETMEQFPKKMAFEVFGTDRIAQFNIQVGQLLTVSFDVDAHEYNGRWFNQIRAWRVVPYDPAAVPAPSTDPAVAGAPGAQPSAAPFPPAQSAEAPFPPAQEGAPAPAAPAFGGESTDDLPF